jgi:hypothetical protein
MGFRRGCRWLGVGHFAGAINLIVVRLGYENDIVFVRLSEMPDDMEKLPREILVNKQEFHGFTPPREPTHWSMSIPSGPSFPTPAP